MTEHLHECIFHSEIIKGGVPNHRRSEPARLLSLTSMPRHLRPRKTRQSYASLFQSEDEQENSRENLPGPSRQLPDGQQEDDSGSDFAPPAPEEVANTDEHSGDDGLEDPASLGDGMDAEVDSSSESSSSMRRSKKKSSTSQGKAKSTGSVAAKGKTKQKTKAIRIRRSKSPAPAVTPNPATHPSTAPAATPITSARHGYALPNPNVHHRHRPVPLFSGPTAAPALAPAPTSTSTALLVERLQRAPLLFAPNEILPTNAYASSALLTRRVGKAWGAGVGAGPVWQIVEDLGWFREAEELKPGVALEQQDSGEAAAVEPASVQVYDERRRRPMVYEDVVPPDGWAVPLCAECVSTFHS